MIVMFAFIFALGIVVDDAIVVIENTHRIHAKYPDIRLAAKLAAGEVFLPILSGTLTNYVCAFVRAPVSCVTIAKTAPVTYTCESSGCQKVTAAEVEDYFGGVSGCVHDTSGDSCYTVGTITRCDQRWVCSAGTVSRTCDGGVNPTPAKGYILTGTTTKQVQANGGTQNQLIESWLGPDLATNNCAATPYLS